MVEPLLELGEHVKCIIHRSYSHIHSLKAVAHLIKVGKGILPVLGRESQYIHLLQFLVCGIFLFSILVVLDVVQLLFDLDYLILYLGDVLDQFLLGFPCKSGEVAHKDLFLLLKVFQA